MNLILSQDSDVSTTEVCEWFYAKKTSFERVNVDSVNLDLIDYSKVSEKQLSSFLESYFSMENKYDYSFEDENTETFFGFLREYDSIWYRRPVLSLKDVVAWLDDSFESNSSLNAATLANKKSEFKNLFHFIVHQIQSNKKLGAFDKTEVNKLVVLKLAKSFNIKIPRTTVVSTKKRLISAMDQYRNGIITKSIYEPIHVLDKEEGGMYVSYTYKIEDCDLEMIPDFFSPSLIQENLDKEYEIRSFYISGEFYSMAIFSQKNDQTRIDFRDYDYETPNRSIPFQLPSTLEAHLTELMNSLGLNSGSIDLVKTCSGDFVFLEVNPVGQFGMVSYPCNYNLEYQIFKFLTNE